MIRRKLGNSPVEVSAVSLGCWIFGVDWWGHRTQEDCNRMCSFSRDLGITFFDNCWDYNDGASQVRMGKALKDGDRKKVFLMDKIDGRTKTRSNSSSKYHLL